MSAANSAAAPNSAAAQAAPPASPASNAAPSPQESLARRIWNSVGWRFLVWTPLTIGVGVKFGVALALCFAAVVTLAEGIALYRKSLNPFVELLKSGKDDDALELFSNWIGDVDPKTTTGQTRLKQLNVAFNYALQDDRLHNFAHRILSTFPQALEPHCDQVLSDLIRLGWLYETGTFITKCTAHFSDATIRAQFRIVKDKDEPLAIEFLKRFSKQLGHEEIELAFMPERNGRPDFGMELAIAVVEHAFPHHRNFLDQPSRAFIAWCCVSNDVDPLFGTDVRNTLINKALGDRGLKGSPRTCYTIWSVAKLDSCNPRIKERLAEEFEHNPKGFFPLALQGARERGAPAEHIAELTALCARHAL